MKTITIARRRKGGGRYLKVINNHYIMQKPCFFLTIMAMLLLGPLSAQVSISTNNGLPDSSAMLDVQSTEKGVLVPRMTEAQRDAISNPATGLLVFVTNDNEFYAYDGSGWRKAGSHSLSLIGNNLQLSNGVSVDLSPYLDNTDTQDLSLNNNTLSLTNGGSVDLSSFKDADNLGNHTATQNLRLNGHYLSGDGDNEGLFIDNAGNVGIGTNSPAHKLEVHGDVGFYIRFSVLGNTYLNSNSILLKDRQRFNASMILSANEANQPGLVVRTLASSNGSSILSVLDQGGDVEMSVLDNGNMELKGSLFTEGDAGIGTMTTDARLHLVDNATGDAGGIKLSQAGTNSLIYHNNSGDLILRKQDQTGQLTLNGNGDVTIENDLTVNGELSMRNNIVWGEALNEQYYQDETVGIAYQNVVSINTPITVNQGDILQFRAWASARMAEGSKIDEFSFRVFATGANGCGTDDFYTNLVDQVRPSQDPDDHNDFRRYAYQDYYTVDCSGTYTFKFQINNTGDDDWEVRDASLIVTKY